MAEVKPKRSKEQIISDSAARSAAGAQQRAADKALNDKMTTAGAPGPRPGGLAEALSDPNRLVQSLASSREARQRTTADLRQRGFKDPSRQGNTVNNQVGFADGATRRSGSVPVPTNPRFNRAAPTE